MSSERERERETGNIDKKREWHVYSSLSSYCGYALFFQSLNAAPAGDHILTESDAVNILEELTEAQNSANLLGLMFNIKPFEVEAIQARYQNPKERLCQIILAFLRQAEPPLTWRAIVNAGSVTVKAVSLAVTPARVWVSWWFLVALSHNTMFDQQNTEHCCVCVCVSKMEGVKP